MVEEYIQDKRRIVIGFRVEGGGGLKGFSGFRLEVKLCIRVGGGGEVRGKGGWNHTSNVHTATSGLSNDFKFRGITFL